MYNPSPAPIDTTNTKDLKIKCLELATTSVNPAIDPVALAKEMYEWVTDNGK
jgi:hypothetical protein